MAALLTSILIFKLDSLRNSMILLIPRSFDRSDEIKYELTP